MKIKPYATVFKQGHSLAITLDNDIVKKHNITNKLFLPKFYSSIRNQLIIDLPDVTPEGKLKLTKNQRWVVGFVSATQPITTYNVIEYLKNTYDVMIDQKYINDMCSMQLLKYIDNKLVLSIRALRCE